MTNPDTREKLKELDYFIGTESYHRASAIVRNVVMTDGVKYLCDTAQCYWFVDVIVSYLPRLARVGETFAVASVTKSAGDNGCMFRLDNGNDKASGLRHQYAQQHIPMTDFPFDVLGRRYDLYIGVAEEPDNAGGRRQLWVISLKSEY